MKTAIRIAAPLAAAFVAAPLAASAQNAIMRDDATLRAGPGFQYPRVAYVPEDARVYIHGCLRGFSWCDVSWRGDRGWVDASNLGYSWNNRYVIVGEWGPRIGLPVIAFSVEDYWTRYYRNRPWWSERYTWFERDRNWRGGDRWRDQDRWDRDQRRGDERRDRQRGDRDDWRDRQRTEDGDWRSRQGSRDDDGRRLQQRQDGQSGWRQRDDGQLGQEGVGRLERNRGGDNAPAMRGSERRQGVDERM